MGVLLADFAAARNPLAAVDVTTTVVVATDNAELIADAVFGQMHFYVCLQVFSGAAQNYTVTIFVKPNIGNTETTDLNF